MTVKTNYKRPESVLVLVFTAQQTVLLLQRLTPDDYWQSITGSLEWQEQPEQAAIRELYEETGLALESGTLIDQKQDNQFAIIEPWRSRYHPDDQLNTEHVFTFKLDREVEITLSPMEHCEYSWLAAPEAVKRANSVTNQQAIRQYISDKACVSPKKGMA